MKSQRSTQIVLEHEAVDLAEVGSIDATKTSDGYLLRLKDISFYQNQDLLEIKQNLFFKKVRSDAYLAQIELLDHAFFHSNHHDVVLFASDNSICNVNDLNCYANIISSWNKGKTLDWRNLSRQQRKIWLDACSDWQWTTQRHIHSDLIVDCRKIIDISSLYCCLGEVFFGEKGYIGRNLDALDDCLLDLQHANRTIIFQNSHQLLSVLNTPKNKALYQDDYVSILLVIFNKHGFCTKLL